MWLGPIMLAVAVVLVSVGFWWSGRGLSDYDRFRMHEASKKSGGWGAGI